MTDPDEAALLAIAALAAGDAPQEALFGALAEQAARRLSVDAAAVLRFLGEDRAVVAGAWRAGGSHGLPVNAELDLEGDASALAQVLRTRRPSRADRYDDMRGELALVMRSIGLTASVAAPVLVEGRTWGALVASSAGEQPLAEGAEKRLGDLARVVEAVVAARAAREHAAGAPRRLVEAGDAARRALERELHDVAHQQLLALALRLRVARARAGGDAQLEAILGDALEETTALSSSLDEVGRRLHPAVLDERGIGAAVQKLAARAGMPIRLLELPRRRFAPVVEATAYAVVAGALDAAGDDDVDHATLAVRDHADRIVVEVGAPRHRPGWDAGLAGVADRVEALDGRLDVEGDHVRAVIPLDG